MSQLIIKELDEKARLRVAVTEVRFHIPISFSLEIMSPSIGAFPEIYDLFCVPDSYMIMNYLQALIESLGFQRVSVATMMLSTNGTKTHGNTCTKPNKEWVIRAFHMVVKVLVVKLA